MLRGTLEQFTVAEAMCDPVSLNDPFRNSREENKIRLGMKYSRCSEDKREAEGVLRGGTRP
jgi:hypothetical protein